MNILTTIQTTSENTTYNYVYLGQNKKITGTETAEVLPTLEIRKAIENKIIKIVN